MLEPQYQPEHSSICGQVCVAMAVQRPARAVIAALGHRRATTGRQLIGCLDFFGLQARTRILHPVIPKNPGYEKALPARCIAACRNRGYRGGHWVLIWDGELYDPVPGGSGWEYISSILEFTNS